jgi:transcriptional regulator with XRE-family HTH domain
MDEIRNHRAYRQSKARLVTLRRGLVSAHTSPCRLSDRAQQRHNQRWQGQVVELACSIAGYEALRSAGGMSLELSSLRELGEALIKARITRGWTQERLAQALHMPKQQIQRYEATQYASASFRRIAEVAEALEVRVAGNVSCGLGAVHPREVDPTLLSRSLAGFAAVEVVQDIEKRIRLRALNVEAARKDFDNLCDTYDRLSPFHATAGNGGVTRSDHRLAVRRAIQTLARERGEHR